MINNEELKVGRLSIALYPTHLTEKYGKLTYHAKVVNREKASMVDICNDLVASGNNCGLTTEQLKTVWQNICQARIKRLTEGISTEDEIGTLCPSIKGTFDDDQSPYEKGRQAITVRLRPSASLSNTMASLTLVITQGNTRHPVIDSVEDLKTKTDTTLTPGGLLVVKGRNICVIGDDETVGVYFDNVASQEDVVKVPFENMSANAKNTLCLIVPTELKVGGRYGLRLVTQYNGSSKKEFRKEPQTACAAEFQVSERTA